MHGTIFDIQRFSSHDGPGIRTTVFLKGCSLHCFWCHNPESIAGRQELLYYTNKCIGCGTCAQVCPTGAQQMVNGSHVYDSAKCSVCGECVSQCPPMALALTGRIVDTEEVIETIKRDLPFYANSGGGVTFSGGEALLQADFVRELLIACKTMGLHTAVDTAGAVPWDSFEKVLAYTDLFLYDVKAADASLHRQGVGSDNSRILENLVKLSESGAAIRIRIPVIPGFNASKEEIMAIGKLISPLQGIEAVELLRFHKMGEGKYTALGQEYAAGSLTSPTDGQMEELRSALDEQVPFAVMIG